MFTNHMYSLTNHMYNYLTVYKQIVDIMSQCLEPLNWVQMDGLWLIWNIMY